MASVCVIGGGPAGSVFAARMAQLGHQVTLLERARFPRRHVGESLSPGVLPLLESAGARGAVEAASFPRIRRVHVQWDTTGAQVREDPRAEGLLVDRGVFDAILLEHARRCGVRVLQPARVVERQQSVSGWLIEIVSSNGARQLRADFIADAGGRDAAAHPERVGRRTLALYAYWQGSHLPTEPGIEAAKDAWYWSVPLPGGLFNLQVFVDPRDFDRAHSNSLENHYHALLAQSRVLASSPNARLAGCVRAIDATAYLHSTCVTAASIRVGEAAMAIDPVSSSGVQLGVQSALAGAVVANTLLCRPESAQIAARFFQESLRAASKRHARWAAGYYARAAARFETRFWQERAAGAALQDNPKASPIPSPVMPATALTLSPQLIFADVPCLDGEFVMLHRGLLHPALETAVVYVGGHEAAALLQGFRAGCTILELARSWTDRMPMESGLAIAAWLVNHSLLETQISVQSGVR